MPPELPKEAGDNPWILVLFLVITLLGTIVGGAGGVEMIRAFTRRKPKTAVEVTNQIELAKQLQLYAQQLEEDSRQARASEQAAWLQSREHAAQAWRQADETQQKLVTVNRKLDETMGRVIEMGRYMDALVMRIHAPGATIEGVREFIISQPPPAAQNGRRHS